MKISHLCILFCILFTLCSCTSQDIAGDGTTTNLFAMNTYMTITVYGDNSKLAVEAIESRIYELDGKWSVTNPKSEISILNSTKQATISEDTRGVLNASDEMYNLTDGAFNISIFPVVKLWGFTTGSYQIPTAQDIENALLHLDPSSIKIHNDTASISDAHTELDLGAIAKGYTTDIIKGILIENNIPSAIISLGGNIYAHGTRPNGSPWGVALQSPFDADKRIGYIDAVDLAVITSGAYERYFEYDGKIYHHIIDPETGLPADNNLVSVTIVCEDAAMADALSTALFVMGLEKGSDFWRKNAEIFDVIFITEDGEVFISENIESKFHRIDKTAAISIIR